MITILIVASPRAELDALEGKHPAVEVLFARDAEEAIEKLGRNRRIDAVLLLEGDLGDLAAQILEDNPAAPPIYAPVDRGPAAGVRSLPDSEPADLVSRVLSDLSG